MNQPVDLTTKDKDFWAALLVEKRQYDTEQLVSGWNADADALTNEGD